MHPEDHVAPYRGGDNPLCQCVIVFSGHACSLKAYATEEIGILFVLFANFVLYMVTCNFPLAVYHLY